MDDVGLMPLMTAMVAAVAIAAIAYAVIYPYIASDRIKDKRVAQVREATGSKKSATRSAAEIAASRKKQVAESIKEMEKRQKAEKKVSLRLKLEQAGLDYEPKHFWMASALSGVVFAIAAAALAPASAALMRPLFVLAGALVGSLGVPRFVLAKIIARRQKKFLDELANSIDVIVRGIKSGLPLNECFAVIAKESPEPVAGEFREAIEQQRIGVPLSEALERMTRRVPLSEVKFLAIVIAIQQQSGGNLAEALSNLSGVLRDRIKMAMKVKALSAEAKASAMILGFLPPGVMFMVYQSSPDYLQPLFDTRTGNLFIIGGIAWMATGIMVMRKMINFKF
jgi:tight adherence protein B